jgi:CheY-like chemotaxis protein
VSERRHHGIGRHRDELVIADGQSGEEQIDFLGHHHTGRLIVEEVENLAYALGHLLNDAGYEVSVFTNANEARDDLRRTADQGC